jgi:hypothetical protein
MTNWPVRTKTTQEIGWPERGHQRSCGVDMATAPVQR